MYTIVSPDSTNTPSATWSIAVRTCRSTLLRFIRPSIFSYDVLAPCGSQCALFDSEQKEKSMKLPRLLSVLAVSATLTFSALASSHREAPLITEDPTMDNTDVYVFRSPDNPNTVTIIANYIPLEEPSNGPNFYNFSPSGL